MTDWILVQFVAAMVSNVGFSLRAVIGKRIMSDAEWDRKITKLDGPNTFCALQVCVRVRVCPRACVVTCMHSYQLTCGLVSVRACGCYLCLLLCLCSCVCIWRERGCSEPSTTQSGEGRRERSDRDTHLPIDVVGGGVCLQKVVKLWASAG